MKDYYIGLDIGTDSIGWAVTDTQYNILKFKGNAQWGIRLLEESNTAAERRSFRSARRRIERNKFRTQCLEMLFDEQITKIDPSFFHRLHESNLQEDDKNKAKGSQYLLFNDPDFTDKDYHKNYPTIYHLRKYLVENKTEPVDVRLVFLALSHIIKNRGHFLFDDDTLGDGEKLDFKDIWCQLSTCLNDEMGISLECSNISDIHNILKDKTKNITTKKTELTNVFSLDKKSEKYKQEEQIIKLLSGGTADADKLFADENLKNTEAKSITFSKGFDENADNYEQILGDRFEILEKLKAVYDCALLDEILNGEKYLSFAKCRVYDKHKADLQILKNFIKTYKPEIYKKVFKDKKLEDNEKKKEKTLKNYCAYSGHCDDLQNKCTQEDFIAFLKKELKTELLIENLPPEYQQMVNDVNSGNFMPKIVSKDNAVIPMQVNLSELKAILNNAQNYLPFLNNKDTDGKTVSDKIIDIFKFRIPYYVGPLNKHSGKAWLERTNEKIYPWNFDRVVDTEKSAEKFIENLTSKCTYLYTEDVLPKNSLAYCKFTVLNELNNLKIDGKDIGVELKQNIYRDLFENNKKVTNKRLQNYLKSNGITDVTITGIDGDFKSNLKSFIDLKPYNLSNADKEEIIKTITIFGDDKKLLKKRLRNKFSSKLTEEEILKIAKLKYSDWGRLSNKFLNNVYAVEKETGEYNNILGFMWSTNNNLMQLLSENFEFNKKLDEINGKQKFTSLKAEIDDLYISPKVKRPVYQAMQIVEELIKINGCEPKKIFIEVARGPEEKKRTVSRKSRLLELYKNCKKDNIDLFNSLEKTPENEFRRDALYLYYTQFGKCMYTGEDIPLESIYNKNLYDIDHIYPRSKIKDDSLDNRVLVCKKANEDKSNIYPISPSVRDKMSSYWKLLLDKDLISKKKYERLVRSYPLTDDELSQFINRQLVETRQSTKAISHLLEKRYPSAKIIPVKAGLVSDFRQEYKFVKCREVNDFHHAKDAYLNIVVGNVYNVRFTQKWFIPDLREGEVSLNKMFDFDTNGAWTAKGDSKSIDIVEKTMSKNNIRFTRYAFKKKGGLFDQTRYKKGKAHAQLKKNLPIEKYGGYSSVSVTCFALVSYKQKNKTVKQLFPVNLYEEKAYFENPKVFIDNKLNVDSTIIIPCVKINTLVSMDGFRMHVSSKDDSNIKYKPAMQLVLSPSFEKYVKMIANYLNKCVELKTEKPITEFDGITAEKNLNLYDELLLKFGNIKYNSVFNDVENILITKKQDFQELSLKSQCELLIQILNIFHCNSKDGNLSSIAKKASNMGRIRINNKITLLKSKGIKSFKIINQSITGLFEQEIELLN